MEKVKKSIKEVHEKVGHNQYVLKMRSSFAYPEELDDLMSSMKDFLMDRKRKYMEKNGMTGEPGYKFDVEKSISCTMSEMECPAKSAKILAKMAPVKVLNPDIFYLLNTSENDTYGDNDLIIYDECHNIEDVVKRIFQAKLPLETLKDFYGIDLLYLYELDEVGELLPAMSNVIHRILGPLLAFSQTLSMLGDIMSVKTFHGMKRCRSRSKIAKMFYEGSSGILLVKDIDIMKIIKRAIQGDFYEEGEEERPLNHFMNAVYAFFQKKCDAMECSYDISSMNVLVDSLLIKHTKQSMAEARKHRTRKLTKSEASAGVEFIDIIVPEDRIVADHIIAFGKCIEPFVRSAINLQSVKSKEYPCFSINKLKEPRHTACKGTKFSGLFDNKSDYAKKNESCMELVPILVGPLMKVFFYSKAKHVLLTSGTWVDQKGLFKIYGLPDDCEFIKIPSTFKPDNRRIYVIDNKNFVNFSQKISDGSYFYKTEMGSRKFTSDMNKVMKSVREFIRNQSGENSNMVIHPHTFDICSKIAEFAPGVDGSYLIHLPEGRYIKNVHTGYVSEPKTKDELIDTIKRNPDSGLTIVSPSISEGVDFKGKIARAQIILKRPIPYLGDIYVRSYYKGNSDVGLERDPNYLDRVCYTVLTQQYGRVMRGKDDWGITIIMDQSITESLRALMNVKSKDRIKEMNIDYFTDGIRFKTLPSGRPEFKWIFK